MPKLPIDYQKTVIYKFVCNDINIKDTYVGATTNFIKRKACHKTNCNNPNSLEYNKPFYLKMRLYGGFSNWKMLEVEKYPCNTKIESDLRERHFIELLNANMNAQVPGKISALKNCDKYNAKKRVKHKCVCGLSIAHGGWARHTDINQHLLYQMTTLSNDLD